LKILKSSGKYLERQAQKSLGLAFLCIVVVAILVLISFPKLPTRVDLGDYEAVFVLAIVFPVIGILYYSRRYRTYKMGAEGETRVTQVLTSKLSDDFYLINDVVYTNERGNKENIDHVVLGPNGVFAIETKNYLGKVTYKNGYWQVPFPFGRSPSSQAKGNASWVNRAINACGTFETLKVWVEPIVVFSNPDVQLEVIDPEVQVVTLPKLADLITSYNNDYSFSPEQLRLMGEGILKQASLSIKQSEQESARSRL
jgi:hypothetical protein